MSGTHPTPAEQHLGDRLAALVDGELGHDARERVLAHLATCARCKAEADAQRRVKSYFAQAAPPPPSEGLLARLQGLPAGALGGDDPGGGLFGTATGSGFGTPPGSGPDGGGLGAERAAVAPGLRGGVRRARLPARAGRPRRPRAGAARRTGRFRFPYPRGRPCRGGEVAVARPQVRLRRRQCRVVRGDRPGGALPAATTADARGDGTGSKVTPLRSASGQSSSTGADGQRRRGGGALSAAGTGSSLSANTGVARLAERSGAAPPPFLHAAAPLTAAGPLPPGSVPGQLDLLAPLAGPLGTLPGPYASDPVPGSVAGPLPTAAPTTGIAAPPP
ncbi:anti-sigma factor [Streptomyces sp. CC228A]|uniref:anti-sigma factor family protein n=1 Tax=Streptomyces sp. CC228A TaxID=2898186 RepID=UPI001F47D07D|nr:zf-HC2 domain-containing protein [Streptomyces sp. CC228A]